MFVFGRAAGNLPVVTRKRTALPKVFIALERGSTSAGCDHVVIDITSPANALGLRAELRIYRG